MYRIRTTFSGATGSPWVNTLFFSETGGSAQQAANAAAIFWQAVDAEMHTSITWSNETDVLIVNEDTGAATGVVQVEDSSGAGSNGVDLLPPATQALVRLRTGVFNDGREIRGRIFIPGLTEGANTAGGSVNGATATVIGDAAAALVADANSELLVWSRSALQAHGVVAASVWNQFAILRSRRD